MSLLTRADILRGLHKIDQLAQDGGVIIELSIYGGAALALVFDLRVMTRDVDAVVRGSPDFLREAAQRVAEEENWPLDWLNDGVKGFVSANEEMEPLPEFENSGLDLVGGLRIFTPTPQYLFAMKCMAMRAEGIDGSHDISDIEALADLAEVKDADDAMELVTSFYPNSRITPKVHFGVQEIMERVVRKRQVAAEQPPTG